MRHFKGNLASRRMNSHKRASALCQQERGVQREELMTDMRHNETYAYTLVWNRTCKTQSSTHLAEETETPTLKRRQTRLPKELDGMSH